MTGAAALNRHIFTVKGGIQNYNDEIGIAYIEKFVKAHSDAINEDIIAKEKRNNIKVG